MTSPQASPCSDECRLLRVSVASGWAAVLMVLALRLLDQPLVLPDHDPLAVAGANAMAAVALMGAAHFALLTTLIRNLFRHVPQPITEMLRRTTLTVFWIGFVLTLWFVWRL